MFCRFSEEYINENISMSLINWGGSFTCTVEPWYKDHLWAVTKVVFMVRWSLYWGGRGCDLGWTGCTKGGLYSKVVSIPRWSLTKVWLYFAWVAKFGNQRGVSEKQWLGVFEMVPFWVTVLQYPYRLPFKKKIVFKFTLISRMAMWVEKKSKIRLKSENFDPCCNGVRFP